VTGEAPTKLSLEVPSVSESLIKNFLRADEFALECQNLLQFITRITQKFRVNLLEEETDLRPALTQPALY
jgi:hypothetical protein